MVTAETSSSTVTVHDDVRITTTDHTAQIASTPVVTVHEAQLPRARTPSGAGALGKHSAAPSPIDDEPSDGVVRPIEGEPSSRALPPPPRLDVVDDRPAAKTGEISSPGVRRKAPTAPPPAPPDAEPSILVHDLAAAQQAVAAVAAAQSAAPPTIDAKSPAQEGMVSAVRKDATGAFTKAEEEFFREGYEAEKAHHKPVPSESFDDLDDGYRPAGFWDRLRGKNKKKR